MFVKILHFIFGNSQDDILKSFQKTLKKINSLESSFIQLTNDELKKKLFFLKFY